MSVLCCVRLGRYTDTCTMFNCMCGAAIQIVRRFLWTHCFQLKIDSLRRWIWYTNNRSHFNEQTARISMRSEKLTSPNCELFTIPHLEHTISHWPIGIVVRSHPSTKLTQNWFSRRWNCARCIFDVVFFSYFFFEKLTVKSIKDSKHN